MLRWMEGLGGKRNGRVKTEERVGAGRTNTKKVGGKVIWVYHIKSISVVIHGE